MSWLVAMRNAACTVLPSITEGFGLAAAESISQGVATLYQRGWWSSWFARTS